MRLRVETEGGALRAIRETDRVITFLEDDTVPIESAPGSLAFDEGDGDVTYALLARPRLHALDLDERRVVGSVERGERFGRATTTVTFEHTYHDDFALRLVLDAVTGMPLEMAEAGRVLLEWLELETWDAVDDSLLRWDGDTRGVGWFAYVGAVDGELDEDADVPESVREEFRDNARRAAALSAGFDHSPLVARVPMEVRVDSFDPAHVAIDLEPELFVSIRGHAGRPDSEPEDAEVWTTSDGWTWTLSAPGLEDPELVRELRERVVAWRSGLGHTAERD